MWAERVVSSSIAAQALESGYATEGDLRRLADAWRTWADEPAGWFSVLHGELICIA